MASQLGEPWCYKDNDKEFSWSVFAANVIQLTAIFVAFKFLSLDN